MNARYLNERAALAEREGEMVEITVIGGPREFLPVGPSPADYIDLARRAYVRDDLTVAEFEAELDRAHQQ